MKTKKLLNCKFTDEEMRQFGITLAQEAQRKERLEIGRASCRERV